MARIERGILRKDGYMNLMNKYGTSQDNSNAYNYQHEGIIPDIELTEQYESSGLFAKIIDTPAEEAVKHGFDIGLKSPDINTYIEDMLDRLDWEYVASTAIKWARLYGGALGVMFIDDDRGLEEPLNWRGIRDIDEIRVYERAIVYPDYTSISTGRSKLSKFGTPELYQVSSIYGQFWVHESRCLIFRNGILPEQTTFQPYRFWGTPEYLRIRKALRETITTHESGVKLLERSVQAIYTMQGLADLLSTEAGENEVLKRLQIIDMARGFLNSIAIDAENETYDFKSATMTGVKEIVDATCNMLSAVTNIPQAILFGRSPAGMNATGESDLENYYNFIERIQKLMLKPNLTTLIDIIIRAGLRRGKLDEEPDVKLKFNPLWSLSESEQTDLNQKKAQTQQIRAQTAQLYVDMGVLDTSEVRSGLAKEEDFDIEQVLDDMTEEELWGNYEEMQAGAGQEQEEEGMPPEEGAGPVNPQAQTPGQPVEEVQEPEDESEPDKQEEQQQDEQGETEIKDSAGDDPAKKVITVIRKRGNVDRQDDGEHTDSSGSVGVLVIQDGKVLTGCRSESGQMCGPGGHIEPGETPAAAAIRETQEEFGITPMNLIPMGQIEGLADEYGKPFQFLCTEFDGEPDCSSDEMFAPVWVVPSEPYVMFDNMFPPFAESLKMLTDTDLIEKNGQKPLTINVNFDTIIEEDIGSNADAEDVTRICTDADDK